MKNYNDFEQFSKDQVFWERTQLTLLLSKIFQAHLFRHDPHDKEWEKDWHWGVCIHFPTGQGRWHFHKSNKGFYTHLKWKQKCKWDGHTTDEKYERLRNIGRLGTHKLTNEENKQHED